MPFDTRDLPVRNNNELDEVVGSVRFRFDGQPSLSQECQRSMAFLL